MNVTPKISPSKLVPAILLMSSLSWSASTKLTIESLIGTPYPSELVSARKADRIAWIAYAKGARNVHELIVFPDDVHDSLLYSRWLTPFHASENFFKRFLQKE